jgi:hypothetical protein
MRTSNPTCVNDVGRFKSVKCLLLQTTTEESANTYITFVLGFNYGSLTLDSPGNWIHTWVKK